MRTEQQQRRTEALHLRRSLTTLSLVFILYFNTSGGAFSLESLVVETGPGIALLILILVPLVWSIPETLIVAELASMLPEEGGYYRWVHRAFGQFWAFQNGWWTWMYSLFDMAIYPALFNQYLAFFLPNMPAQARWAVALVMIWGAAGVNLRGALPVGRVSIAAGSFVLAAFAALSVYALTRGIQHVPWQPLAAPGKGSFGAIGVGMSIAIWNYIGWDNASTVQGEVVDATHAYPRALAFAFPLVVAGYFIPLLSTLAATSWTQWQSASWADIALLTGGTLAKPLAYAIAIAGMISALALFNALLLAYSRIPLAMALDGLLPRMFAKTDSRGTPRNAVLLATLLYSFFALIPFSGLVVADVMLYLMALSLEFAALIALRIREPNLRGAFRIPAGWKTVALLAALPIVGLFGVVYLEIHDAEHGLPAVLGAIGSAAVGPIVYKIFQHYSRV